MSFPGERKRERDLQMCPTAMKWPLRIANKFTYIDIYVSYLNIIRDFVNMAPVGQQFSMGHGEYDHNLIREWTHAIYHLPQSKNIHHN